MLGSISRALNNVTKQASNAVNNVASGVQQVGRGAQQLGSGDLRGLQTMGGGVVNTGSSLYGNLTSAQNAMIEGAFSPLAGTPLYGMTAGNLTGLNNTVQGILRGNLAGIQDLPTDIGKGVQSALDAGMDIVDALGSALGGGAGGAGGGAQVLESLQNLANQSADYAANLPSEFQRYEGERFAPPSDRTTAAESALYNQTGSNIQGAYDQTQALTNQAKTSQFEGGIQDAREYTPSQTFQDQSYGNASTAGYRNYADQDVSAINTAGAQEFKGNTYGSAGATITPDLYQGQSFDSTTYGATPLQGRNRGPDALEFQAQNYGNAVDQGAQNFESGNTFAQDMAQFENPYNDQIIQSSIADLARARELTGQRTDAQAHAAGAFGGTRHALREAEDTANYYKQVADLSNQMRSQGFNQAAQMAAQDRAQRLGLTAESLAQAGQLGARGQLQGQQLTAGDLQAARDATLRSQLQSNQLGMQGDLQSQQLAAQAGMQGQRLTADSARQAQQLRAQTGMQGQQLSAAARQQANQLGQQAALQGQNLTASDASAARALNQQSYDAAANRQQQALLNAQNLAMQSALQSQQLGAQSFNQMQQLQNQGAMQGQTLSAADRQAVMDANLRAQLQAQELGARSFDNQQNRLQEQQRLNEYFRQGAMGQALTGAQNMGVMGQNLDTQQRQQLLDQLAVGQAADKRAQDARDFDYQQYVDERAFPGQYLDNLNKGGQLGTNIANATAAGAGAGGGGGGGGNPIAKMIGGGLSGFLATGNPWGAAAGAGMSLLGVNDSKSFEGLGALMGNKKPTETTTINPGDNPGNSSYGNTQTSGRYAAGRRKAAPGYTSTIATPTGGGLLRGGFGGGFGGFKAGMNRQKLM